MAAGEETGVFAAAAEGAGDVTGIREAEKGAGKSDFEESEPENSPAVTVCKFFLEGRCRFGESCLNRHEGSPRVEAKERKGSKEEERRRRKKKEVEEKMLEQQRQRDAAHAAELSEARAALSAPCCCASISSRAASSSCCLCACRKVPGRV